ncbi:trafficking protein particle complex subunit 13-like [Paramacrobiotus metropolitanus]|uniref:trafficking protein particle complex subunit 13-like n=1 Tax=Paramacrobiotus metropolitanus TaxID=2943436 RepID=UPI002445E014|nr:trafficking protein particle complex subunit 13-like [Paramacrobiotus metropolitanus]
MALSQNIPPDAKEPNQCLNMKVLRLLKPSFIQSGSMMYEDGGEIDVYKWIKDRKIAAFGQEAIASDDLFKEQQFSLTEELVLPQSFGAMFLGQYLHCYACVSNITNSAVRDITVKLEFQVQSAAAGRSEMVLNEGKQFLLEPQQTFDFIINKEIRDLGSHMMIASITYSNPLNPLERVNLKKCFRYSVARPMDFKNKFVSLPDGGYFGEFNIQNLTNTSIVLETVRMITSPEYTSEEVTLPLYQHPLDTLNMRSFLGPNDSRQFVFRIRLTDRTRTGEILKSSTSPGRVEILWRTRMGDLGKVTTSPLNRAVPDFRDIFVTLANRPAKVELYKAFAVTVAVFSLGTRPMEFVLKLPDQHDRAFAWCGISGRAVGSVAPGGVLEFPLPVVPCSVGLHLFPRFQLIDILSGQRYDSEDLAEIFVE